MRAKLIALLVSLLVVLSSIGYGLWQKSRAEKAEARAEAAEGLVKAHEEANRILNAHLRKVEGDRDKWKKVAQDLEGMEGIDETLSSYLNAILERVR